MRDSVVASIYAAITGAVVIVVGGLFVAIGVSIATRDTEASAAGWLTWSVFAFAAVLWSALNIASGMQHGREMEFLAQKNLHEQQTMAVRVALSREKTNRAKMTTGTPSPQLPSPQLPAPLQTLQTVSSHPNRHVMHLAPASPPVAPVDIKMSDGTTREVSLKHIEALFSIFPNVSQDRWLKAGGGSVAAYGPLCETLCDCVDPLLLRVPNNRGYEMAGDEAHARAWWEEHVD